MNSNSTEDKKENKLLKYLYDGSFDSLSQDQKEELANKTDNFLEALYIAPQLFDSEVMSIMKLRELKLKEWRNNAQFLCGSLFAIAYSYNRFITNGFYFKNFILLGLGTAMTSYVFGRISELLGNRMYYQGIVYKLAISYNITDAEIEDLQLKLNEAVLKEDSEENKKVSSLDKVEFKF